jgi:hypothetical protein
MEGFKVRKTHRTLKPPIPVGLSGSTVKLTVLKDETQVAARGRVAATHLWAVKRTSPETHR